MRRNFDRQKIRLAAFDIDGTLYDRGYMPEGTKEAVTALDALGIRTIISTSRNPGSLPDEVRAIACLRYATFCNGAVIRDIRNGEILESHAVEPKPAREVIEFLIHFGEHLHYVCNDYGVITAVDFETLTRRYPEGKAREWACKDLRKHYQVVPDARALADSVQDPVIKFGCRFPDRETLLVHIGEIQEGIDCEVVETDANMVEITPKGTSKGKGVIHLCRILGIQPEEVIAFGDSGNDVPIFQSVGYAVAMGNAYDDVKEAADYVTGTLAEGGLADAVRKLFLEKSQQF